VGENAAAAAMRAQGIAPGALGRGCALLQEAALNTFDHLGETSSQGAILQRGHLQLGEGLVTAARISKNPPMRTVYACSLRFPGPGPATAIWNEISSWIAEWYKRNAPDVRLPESWADGGSGRLVPRSGHSLEASTLTLDGASAGPLREIRWRYPDGLDPSLVWSVEFALYTANDTFLTLVLKIASVDYELVPTRYQLGTPRIIRTLVGRGDAHVGEHPIAIAPHRVEPDSVDQLIELLLSKTRRHPVVVLSPDPYSETWSVDPFVVSNYVAGVASVQVLSSKWAGFALTDEVGKQYSCYNGAVRIYWPRFSLEADPFFHRLWLPSEISEFGGSEVFARSLLRIIAVAASFRFVEPEPLRAFRRHHDEARLAALKATNASDYDALFEEYAKLDTETRQLREQLEVAIRDNETLRENLSAIWSNPEEPAVTAPKAATVDDRPDLTSVHDAVAEAQQRTTHLVYLDDAFSSAEESPFKQPGKVYTALMAIDEVARRWAEQLAGGPKLGPRKEAFRELGFNYKEDISQTSKGKWGSEYTYIYDGKKTLFAPHITIGAKQVDKCLSIHIFWDESKQRIVIAHVGRHKTNTRS
jgi:hypothetical protein